MKKLMFCLAIFFAGTILAHAEDIVLKNSPGGMIGQHINAFQMWSSEGHRVVIVGNCLSACTLALGIIPRERLCVRGKARFGFHAAWREIAMSNGQTETSPEGTALLMRYYPPLVKSWIEKHGGLTSKMIYASAKEMGVAQCKKFPPGR